MLTPIVTEITRSTTERIAAHREQVKLVRASLIACPPKSPSPPQATR